MAQLGASSTRADDIYNDVGFDREYPLKKLPPPEDLLTLAVGVHIAGVSSTPSHFPTIALDPLPFTVDAIDCPHNDDVKLTDLPGMGLPMEVWLYIIGFLAQDAMSLLACALTCRHLRDSAQSMIDSLHLRSIDASRYDDLNELVEEIRNSSGHARAIRQLDIEGWSTKTGPVAFSVIPNRLSRQLMALRKLTLKEIDTSNQVHPSTWMLFGRAFPSVTRLVLSSIMFPSFKDFVVFVTSFPALIALELSGLRLGSRIIPIGVARNSHKQNLTLQELRVWDETGSFFLAPFVEWLVGRKSHIRRLSITKWTASVPCRRLVSHFREHLQDLTLQYPIRGAYTIEEVQQLHGSAGVFRHGFPCLDSLVIGNVHEFDVPWVTTILPHVLHSLKKLTLRASPTAKNFDFVSWKYLDVVLSSWFVVHHRHRNLKLDLVLWRTFLEGKKCSIEDLLPLTTSLGDGRWCRFNTM